MLLWKRKPTIIAFPLYRFLKIVSESATLVDERGVDKSGHMVYIPIHCQIQTRNFIPQINPLLMQNRDPFFLSLHSQQPAEKP